MHTTGPTPDPAPHAVVFGATGFVGRNITRTLLEAGWRVTAAVRDPAAAGPRLDPGCRPLRFDPVRDRPEDLAGGLLRAGPDTVVNAAGALWGAAAADEHQLHDGNVLLVRRLVDAVAALPPRAGAGGGSGVRLVHIGSAYEYGEQPPGTPLTEDLTEHPVSRYARTKLGGTRAVTGAVAAGRLDGVVLRISTAVGPWAPPDGLLGGIAWRLAAAGPAGRAGIELPPLAGARDFVDVRDVADAVLRAATARRVPPVVNIGGGRLTAVTDAVDLLLRCAGGTARPSGPTAPGERRDAGITAQPLDLGTARRDLRWAPARPLADAVTALWLHARAHGPAPQPAGPGGATAPHRRSAPNGEPTHG
ncbi:NAD(P)-dependent oxidoreductase [Dactylosporangium aurantiacum]|uniref:NAD(P)-dependent oxidoreductase n=1 Tax=Dactylosporangium aurantiacum TaxID=35754 RepID=A0A9Q9ME44_9ACTN|nr:NAD(P)-dependent oxidoreductase [Dactylosporangium aurantiacum]MDG6106860.1 NAD(P)-dependent oxidoreductase [Dactylosporangium aurantiacum]UWZ50995.1 NAD(P)-dependent oxidoreductase [Dactylosporangium aurantiacum]